MALPKTTFELSGRQSWTSLEDGESFLSSVAALSPRLTHMTLGQSVEGRPINAVMVGYPTPNPSNDVVLIVSGQHGLERASREAVLIMVRDLAATEDPAVLEYLRTTTWLFVPTASPDRVGVDRNNANGVNLNRDWSERTQPETKAIYAAILAYRPVLIVDAHEGRDFSTNFATSAILDPMIHPRIRLESDRVNSAVVRAVHAAGRTHEQYPLPDGAGLLSTAAGLFHAVGLLVESRRSDNDERPPPNERVSDQEIALMAVLGHHRSSSASIAEAAEIAARLSAIPVGGPAGYRFRTGGRVLDVLEVWAGVDGQKHRLH